MTTTSNRILDLSTRISALQETTAQIHALIHRLAHLDLQPGSIPLSGSEGDVSAELSDEIYELIKEQSEDVELLAQEIADLPVPRRRIGADKKDGSDEGNERVALEERVVRVEGELKAARRAFRQAQLQAQKSLEEARRLERALLLQSLLNPPPPPPTDQADAASPTHHTTLFPRKPNAPQPTAASREVQASSDITLSLRRTHALLSSELSKSQFAHETLRESTAALDQLGERYSTLDGMIGASRQLLGSLLNSQKSDTWYLETAFMVLAATVGWLVFRRWIYGPAWWLVYLPLRILWRSWMSVFTVLGLRGGAGLVKGHGSNQSAGMLSTQAISATGISATPVVASMLPNGQEPPAIVGGKQIDSLVEELGRVVDGSEPVVTPTISDESIHEDAQEMQKNPLKRQWEEDMPEEQSGAARGQQQASSQDATIREEKDEL